MLAYILPTVYVLSVRVLWCCVNLVGAWNLGGLGYRNHTSINVLYVRDSVMHLAPVCRSPSYRDSRRLGRPGFGAPRLLRSSWQVTVFVSRSCLV